MITNEEGSLHVSVFREADAECTNLLTNSNTCNFIFAYNMLQCMTPKSCGINTHASRAF